MSYSYSRNEMETNIIWDEMEKKARVYTASPVTMRKLDKLVTQFPAVYRRTWTEETDGRITAAKYEFDARFVRLGKPASAAQREAGKRLAARIDSATRKAQ